MITVFYDTEPEKIFIQKRPNGFCRVYLRKSIRVVEEPIENEEDSEHPLISYRWVAEENQMSGYGFDADDLNENFDTYWAALELKSKSEIDRIVDAEMNLSEIDNAICEIYDFIMEAGE